MISLDNVHKAFGPKQVLQGVSLEVPEGDTVAEIRQSSDPVVRGFIEGRADVDTGHAL